MGILKPTEFSGIGGRILDGSIAGASAPSKPAASLGENGDYAIMPPIDSVGSYLYGPKANGAWPDYPFAIFPCVDKSINVALQGGYNGSKPGSQPLSVVEWSGSAPTDIVPWRDQGVASSTVFTGPFTYTTDGWAPTSAATDYYHMARFMSPSLGRLITPSNAQAFIQIKAVNASAPSGSFFGVGMGAQVNGHFAGLNAAAKFVIWTVDTYYSASYTQVVLGSSTVAVGDYILYERVGPIVRATLLNSSLVLRETLYARWSPSSLYAYFGGAIGAYWHIQNDTRINNFYGTI